jgi:type III pantothenate kinase
MILDIDMGNTRLKWRIRDRQHKLAQGFIGIEESLELLVAEIQSYHKGIDAVFVASVVGEQLEQRLEAWSISCLGLKPKFARTEATHGSVRNGYREPHMLGVDRWLMIIAAYYRANGACIVISCGTAITVDLIGYDGEHLGGYIAPGLGLMRASLTSNTRLIKLDHSPAALSLSPAGATAEAVYSACAAMLIGLIDNGIRQMRARAQGCQFEMILTGGDADKLISFYPRARLIPDLVLDGLACALGEPQKLE